MNKFTLGFIAGFLTLAIMAKLHNLGEQTACERSGYESGYCQCMETVGLLKQDGKP